MSEPDFKEINTAVKQNLQTREGAKQIVDAIEDYICVQCREFGLPDPQRSKVSMSFVDGTKQPECQVFGVPVSAADCDTAKDVRHIVWERYLEQYGPPKPQPRIKLDCFTMTVICEPGSVMATKVSDLLKSQQAGDGLFLSTPRHTVEFTAGSKENEAHLIQTLRSLLNDMQNEYDSALTRPGGVAKWLSDLSFGGLVLAPRYVKAKISTCGFSGHNVETVIDMTRVVSVYSLDDMLDGGPPVHLSFGDGQVVQVEGTIAEWSKRFGECQKWQKRVF